METMAVDERQSCWWCRPSAVDSHASSSSRQQ